MSQRICSSRDRSNLLHESVTIAVRREYILNVLLLLKLREVRVLGQIVPVEPQPVLRREIGRVYHHRLLPQVPAISEEQVNVARDIAAMMTMIKREAHLLVHL